MAFRSRNSASGLALAQSAAPTGVTENTDPAKIAEIERHAQQLASGAQTTPAMGEHDHHMKKHATRHHRRMGKHASAMKEKDKAPADMPMATEGKK